MPRVSAWWAKWRVTPWWLTGDVQVRPRTVRPSYCRWCRRELIGTDWTWGVCFPCGPLQLEPKDTP